MFSETFSNINDPDTCYTLCSLSYNFFFLYSPPNLPNYCVCSLITSKYPPISLNDTVHQICNSPCTDDCDPSTCNYCGSIDGEFASSYSICKYYRDL